MLCLGFEGHGEMGVESRGTEMEAIVLPFNVHAGIGHRGVVFLLHLCRRAVVAALHYGGDGIGYVGAQRCVDIPV